MCAPFFSGRAAGRLAPSLDATWLMSNMRHMSKRVFSVHIEPIPQGGFYVTVPAFSKCRMTAKTLESALRKAKAQIEKHLITLAKARQPIPTESQAVRPLCLPIRVNLPRGARTILASKLVR